MAQATFDDFLYDTALAKAHRAKRPVNEPTLTKAANTAVDELEQLVAEGIHANPALTRQSVVGESFRAKPGLYDRVREETTLDNDGRTLREIYGRVETSKADVCIRPTRK